MPDPVLQLLDRAIQGPMAQPGGAAAPAPSTDAPEAPPPRDRVLQMLDRAVAGTMTPSPENTPMAQTDFTGGLTPDENTGDLHGLIAGGTGDVPVVPPGRNATHVWQGLGRLIAGTLGFAGDYGAKPAQDAYTDQALAQDQKLHQGPMAYNELGASPGYYTDDAGKVVQPDRSQTADTPGLLSSQMILGPLKGTRFDPYGLPIETGADMINEGIGAALGNLPLLALGGPEAVAGSVLRRIGISAARGAAEGAATGLVETPGDAKERLKAAGEGALMGAGVGAGAPALAETGSAVWNRFGGKQITVPGLPGPVSERSANRVGQRITKDIGPQGVAAVDAAATPGGQPYTEGYTPTVGQIVTNQPGMPKQNVDAAMKLDQEARAADKGVALNKARDQANSERAAIDTAGGTGDPAATREGLQDNAAALDDYSARQTQTARQDADTAKAEAPTPNPDFANDATRTAGERYGADARASLLTARKKAENELNDLSAQINADGNVVVDTAPIRHNINERYTLGRYEERPSGKEADILADLQSLPTNASLRDLQALRQRADDEIAALTPLGATRLPEAARRLTSVKQSIDQAIDESVTRAQSGQPSRPLTGDQRFMTPQEASVYGQVKVKGQELKQNFDSNAVGDVLQFGGAGDYSSGAKTLVGPDITRARGGFSRGDAEVLPRIWDGSENENANVAQFLAAGGKRDRLESWIAHDLSEAATDPKTGYLDPVKYAAYRRQHASGLNATPNVSFGFDNLHDAQQNVSRAIADGVALKDAFNSTAVVHFLNMEPRAAVAELLSGDSAGKVSALYRSLPLSSNPELLARQQAARDGVRKAMGDYLAEQYHPLSLTGTTEADLAHAKAFNQALATHADALKMVFGEGYDKFLVPVGRQMTERTNVAPAVRAPVKGTGEHAVTGAGVFQAEMLAELAHEVPGGKEVAALYTVMKWLKSSGPDEGPLLAAGALNPTTTGHYLLNLKAPNGSISPQMVRRLIPYLVAAGLVPRAPDQNTTPEPDQSKSGPRTAIDGNTRMAGNFLDPSAAPDQPRLLDSLPRGSYEERRQLPTDLGQAKEALQQQYDNSTIGRIPILGGLLRRTIEPPASRDDPRYQELMRSYRQNHPAAGRT